MFEYQNDNTQSHCRVRKSPFSILVGSGTVHFQSLQGQVESISLHFLFNGLRRDFYLLGGDEGPHAGGPLRLRLGIGLLSEEPQPGEGGQRTRQHYHGDQSHQTALPWRPESPDSITMETRVTRQH